MERLTSDKSVSQMNMVELAYNSCYGKDGNARYRDFDIDIDARKLAIDLLGGFANTPNEFTDDEDFDEYMLDCLQHGTGDIKGLIAILYRNMWAMADLRGRLKEYEDLEEQGLLLKLPCKVGDTVYAIVRNSISEFIITSIQVYKEEFLICWRCEKGIYPSGHYANLRGFLTSALGKIVFLSQEEAEQALAKMESEVK